MTHTCIEHPNLPCEACNIIIHRAQVQPVEYRRQRDSEPTIEVEDVA